MVRQRTVPCASLRHSWNMHQPSCRGPYTEHTWSMVGVSDTLPGRRQFRLDLVLYSSAWVNPAGAWHLADRRPRRHGVIRTRSALPVGPQRMLWRPRRNIKQHQTCCTLPWRLLGRKWRWAVTSTFGASLGSSTAPGLCQHAGTPRPGSSGTALALCPALGRDGSGTAGWAPARWRLLAVWLRAQRWAMHNTLTLNGLTGTAQRSTGCTSQHAVASRTSGAAGLCANALPWTIAELRRWICTSSMLNVRLTLDCAPARWTSCRTAQGTALDCGHAALDFMPDELRLTLDCAPAAYPGLPADSSAWPGLCTSRYLDSRTSLARTPGNLGARC
jgi:hypothetical protein